MLEAKVIASCIMMAAQAYNLPPALLVGIMKAEGGAIGQQVLNTNGTYDLGPMQINTVWIPQLAKNWNVSEAEAKKWVRDDPCTNIKVSAWILKNHFIETGNLAQAIAHYHSRTPKYGSRYQKRVLKIMKDNGLITYKNKAS